LNEFALLRFQLEFAAGAQVHQDLVSLATVRSAFQVDVPLAVYFQLHDARLALSVHIDYRQGGLHSRLDYSLLHKNRALEQDHTAVAFSPTGDLVGVEDNRFGLARSVLGQA
jgi:hypothetical protein